jgi:hypothetical protein
MPKPTERKWRLITSIAVGLLLTAIAVLLFLSGGVDKGWKLLVFSVLVNLLSSLIVFTVASGLIDIDSEDERRIFAEETILKPLATSMATMAQTHSRQDLSILNPKFDELQAAIRDVQGATTLEQINWAALIAGASEIDFVVQGWDGWIEANASYLRSFMDRGGKFRLFVYDPISEKTNQARALMAERLGKTPHEVVSEIRGTISNIQSIRDELPLNKRTSDNLEIILMTQLNWYFAARFIGKLMTSSSKNRDAIVFSIYSHKKHRVYNMPAITIFPETHPSMASWFDAELAHLRRG